jgi:hypothetical protein
LDPSPNLPPDLTKSDSVDAEGPEAFRIKQDEKIKSSLQNYSEREELIRESTQNPQLNKKRRTNGRLAQSSPDRKRTDLALSQKF